jgi:hypothetical protein
MTTTFKAATVSEQELKRLIRERLGFPAFLTIHRHARLGFTAGVVTVPGKAIVTQDAVDTIVADLRHQYRLKPLKLEVIADRLKQEIVTEAHKQPDGRYLAVSDIAILGRPGDDWSASFYFDGPAITPGCIFQALTLVQNKFALAE